MPLKIQFVIEADGNGLTMSVQLPPESPADPTAFETAAVDLAVFLKKAAHIWLNTQDKTPEQCKAYVDSQKSTRH